MAMLNPTILNMYVHPLVDLGDSITQCSHDAFNASY
jgi:hypothetical protein